MCTKSSNLFNASWWLALTRNSSLKTNNYNCLSPARFTFQDFPSLSTQGLCCVQVLLPTHQTAVTQSAHCWINNKTKNFLNKSVYRASGPEHLRASRTFYRLKLPLVKTPIVPLRTSHPLTRCHTHASYYYNTHTLNNKQTWEMYLQITMTYTGITPPHLQGWGLASYRN